MNSKNSKTFGPNRFLLRLVQKKSLKRNDKFAALSNIRYQLIYILYYIVQFILHLIYIYIDICIRCKAKCHIKLCYFFCLEDICISIHIHQK